MKSDEICWKCDKNTTFHVFEHDLNCVVTTSMKKYLRIQNFQKTKILDARILIFIRWVKYFDLERTATLWTNLYKILKILSIPDSFTSLPPGREYKYLGISWFYRKSPTLRGCNFFANDPLKCPDTQKLSTHPNSFESGLYCFPATREGIVIFDGNEWFSRKSTFPPPPCGPPPERELPRIRAVQAHI